MVCVWKHLYNLNKCCSRFKRSDCRVLNHTWICYETKLWITNGCFFAMTTALEHQYNMKQSGKNMQEGSQYTNTQIFCHLYKDLLKRTIYIYVNFGIRINCPLSLCPDAVNRPSKGFFKMKRISH